MFYKNIISTFVSYKTIKHNNMKNLTLKQASELVGMSIEDIKKRFSTQRLEHAYNLVKDIISVDYYAVVYGSEETKPYIGSIGVRTLYNGQFYNVNSYKEILNISPFYPNFIDNSIRNKANEISHDLPRVKKPNLKKIIAMLDEAQEQFNFALTKFNEEKNQYDTLITILDELLNYGFRKGSHVNSRISYIGSAYEFDLEFFIDKGGYLSVAHSQIFKYRRELTTIQRAELYVDMVKKLKSLEN